MLTDSPVMPTLPVVDLQRAASFYKDKLGLMEEKSMKGAVVIKCGEGTKLLLYQRVQTKADNTAAGFLVTDLEKIVKELKDKGVTFEQYDLPNLKTNADGIADDGVIRSAWFKDTEGNILAISQDVI